MPSQFSRELVQKIPLYGVSNLVAPTFAGIVTAVAQADGSVLVSWAAATGAYLSPAHYQVYISPGSVSAAVLFALPNKLEPLALGATSLQVYVDTNGTTLVAGDTYTFGVRAVSASNISENNTAIQTAVITYNLYSLVASIPSNTWDELKSAHTVSGSFGENLDAKSSDIKKLTIAGL